MQQVKLHVNAEAPVNVSYMLVYLDCLLDYANDELVQIKFEYPDSMSEPVCDNHTFVVGTRLFLRGIATTQPDARTLEFETARDRTLALLAIDCDYPFVAVD